MSGNILWTTLIGHAQYSGTGKFLSKDSYQVAFIDKRNYNLIVTDTEGKTLNTLSLGGSIGMQTVTGWNDTQDYILIQKLNTGLSALINAEGEIKESFDYHSSVNKTRTYHLDVSGDSHEEIIVSDINGFAIYGNADYSLDFSKEKLNSYLFTFYNGER